MRHRIQARPNQTITIGDVGQLVGDEEVLRQVSGIAIHQVNRSDKSIVVLDIMRVLKELRKADPDLDVQTVGPAQTIVEIVYKTKQFRPMFFAAVWLLLFLGAALAKIGRAHV